MNNEDIRNGTIFKERYLKKREIFKDHTTAVESCYDKIRKEMVIMKLDKDIDVKEVQHNDEEYKIFRKLRKLNFIPKIYWRGIVENQLCTIEQYLGPNLDYIFHEICGSKFTMQTVALIGLQLLHNLYFMHGKDVLHNNINPRKILVGSTLNENKLYIVGLRNARKLIKHNKLIGSLNVDDKPLQVSAFSSINIHLGIYPSRKDDIESLGYLIVYFMKGGKLFGKAGKESYGSNENKLKIIERKKLELTPEIFCQGLPVAMTHYFSYLKRLKPFEKPDYELLKKMFRSILRDSSPSPEYHLSEMKFDWVMKIVEHYVEADKRKRVPDEIEDEDCDLDDTLISEKSVKSGETDSLILMTERLENPKIYKDLDSVKKFSKKEKVEEQVIEVIPVRGESDKKLTDNTKDVS